MEFVALEERGWFWRTSVECQNVKNATNSLCRVIWKFQSTFLYYVLSFINWQFGKILMTAIGYKVSTDRWRLELFKKLKLMAARTLTPLLLLSVDIKDKVFLLTLLPTPYLLTHLNCSLIDLRCRGYIEDWSIYGIFYRVINISLDSVFCFQGYEFTAPHIHVILEMGGTRSTTLLLHNGQLSSPQRFRRSSLGSDSARELLLSASPLAGERGATCRLLFLLRTHIIIVVIKSGWVLYRE